MDQVANKTSKAKGPFQARTGLRAGNYAYCQNYCWQEYNRCAADPNMPRTTCDDRYPVCQNACDVCAAY